MKKNSAPTQEALLKSLIDCGRQFYERRWMWGTAGNLSVKLQQKPLEIAITPSGVNKGALSPNQLIVLKGDGVRPPDKRGKDTLVPSAETVIHQAVYKALPGCGTVFHVHPMYATLISSLYGHPTQRRMLHVDWFEMMKGVGVGEEESADIAILPNWQDVSLIARDIQHYLTDTPKALPVVLIYNHGLTGWGRTPEDARNYLEIMEYVCQYLFLKRLLK